MFERLRSLLSKTDKPPPAPTPRTRSRRRTGGEAGRPSPRRRPVRRPPSAEDVREEACPCGKAMLPGWGTTCGNCRPSLASPKTILLATSEVPGLAGVSLGWLAVVRSTDTSQVGALLELDEPVVIVGRGNAVPAPGTRQYAFRDELMSTGHAVLRRPPEMSPAAAFTIEDRRDPGPSANGTFVNARKLLPGESVSLGDGDLIRVGTTELHFRSLWLPPSGAAAR